MLQSCSTYLLNTTGLRQAILAADSVFDVADYEACLIRFASTMPQEPAGARDLSAGSDVL